MIQVRFFARLRDQLGCDSLTTEAVEQDNVTLVRERLVAEHPNWREPLSQSGVLFAVNQELVKSDHEVKDGDEVAFMPPVTGG
ncbi:molybdopterin converting factor subunit 1 [Marinimicrobium locisalis]|uniref:molybdopterin converting factor subunit 1 n=1 Tax=Marinimicrobium locisalis TaxID=546022 RepID=UPI003221B4F7